MALLTFVLAQPGGGGLEIMDLDTAFDKQHSVTLENGTEGSFSLQAGSDEERAIAVGQHDIKVYRESELIGRGRIVSAERSGSDDSIRSFKFVGYKQMLDRKKIWVGDVASNSGYSGIDMEVAGWNLIAASQAKLGGAGAGSFNITRDGTPVGRILSGTKVFDPNVTVREALNDMSQTNTTAGADDGWEWDIVGEGDDLVYHAWAPRRGKKIFDGAVDSGDSANYYFDNRTTVVDFTESFDFSTFANYIIVQGTAGANDKYSLNGGGATGGFFDISYNGYKISQVVGGNPSWAISINTLTDWMERLPGIGQGNIAIIGPDNLSTGGHVYTFEFIGLLAGKPNSTLVFTTTLTGGTGASLTKLQTGYTVTAQVASPDYSSSPFGVVEYYHYDADLTDQASIIERANYLLRTMSNYTPTYNFEVNPAEFHGKDSFWIGDYVIISLRGPGYNIERNDLRITSISFSTTEDGDEGITVEVEQPSLIDNSATNLARRVAAAEALEAKKQKAIVDAKRAQIKSLTNKLNAAIAAQKTLVATKAAAQKYYKTHGNKKIDKGAEANKIASITNQITNASKLQASLKAQIDKLK